MFKKNSSLPENLPDLSPESLVHCSTSEARALVSETLAEKLKVLPIGLMNLNDKEVLIVAHGGVEAEEAARALRFSLEREVRVVLLPARTVEAAIFLAYRGDDLVLEKKVVSLSQARIEKVASELAKAEFRGASGEGAQFLEALIDFAFARKASDIHLLSVERGTELRLRIDGQLLAREEPICSSDMHKVLVARLKVLCGMSVAPKRMPLDGSFSLMIGKRTRTVRTSILPTFWGENVVLRLTELDTPRKLDTLGLDERTLSAAERFTRGSEGLALFCGSTGSGKTTSLYALVERLRAQGMHIITIEEPIERELSGVSQVEVKSESTLTFEAGLRAALRQDPDAIMIGEIRDKEVASVVVNAALSGHLVISTVHAGNVFEALLRLKHLGADLHSVSQALKLIVVQELIPKLCESCKVMDLQATSRHSTDVFRPVGCSLCSGSGFSGRVMITESLTVSGAVKELIGEGTVHRREFEQFLSAEVYSASGTQREELLRKGYISALNEDVW